jgi:hypothetical protein
MMTWLFDTAPRVALWFVHVSSSKWSTCRTQFVHVSHSGLSTCRALVAPRFALWFVHVANDDVSHMANDITTTWQSRGRCWHQSHGCWGVHIFHSWAIKNGLILEKVIESKFILAIKNYGPESFQSTKTLKATDPKNSIASYLILITASK